MTEKILVTGAFGQIGTELVEALQKRYGIDNIIALGHRNIPANFKGILEKGDTEDKTVMQSILKRHKITQIYHLASILSATGEKNPQLAWDVNVTSLKNVLDLAVEQKAKVLLPSSIAVFGPTTPRKNTPQHTMLEPTTMYGVTKVTGELLCQYYFVRYGLDVRGLRYPGLISWKTEPGGGTTDYAVAIFYDAIKTGKYACYLKDDTTMPMMYMDDAIKGTIDIMEADANKIKVRTGYNMAAISFSPKEIAAEIKKHIPKFECAYTPDFRQKIADSWPMSIDDSDARKDWGWKHDYDLSKMTAEMLKHLRKKLAVHSPA
ncbi:MAG TPA: NAD-dependent epimerase/dehydratase family protein [Planctomycetota bacterium]|nr:NAD-dependent epimerase/dehydratase family protein [Planctomycetota bacterium]